MIYQGSLAIKCQITKKNFFFCLRCLNSFTKTEVLDKHKESCEKHDCVKLRMPEKGSILEFENFKHSTHVPIVVYADFECLTKPIESCKPNSEHSYTEQYQKHEPSGFCFNIVCDGKKLKPVLYTKKSVDENIGEIFCKHLKNEIDKVWTSEAQDMVMNEEDKANFETSTNCWICRKDFKEGKVRVRDHCHFTGKYRGAAHQQCNALFRKPRFVPAFFHNLSDYDAHLFVKNLNSMGEGNIDCIPNTEEKYISFSKSIQDEEGKLKYKLRFLGSFKFMSSSLDKLVNNLKPE